MFRAAASGVDTTQYVNQILGIGGEGEGEGDGNDEEEMQRQAAEE